jgi:hypothetical protein
VARVLEALAAMLTSVGICGAAAITAAVLTGKGDAEISRWGYWGTAIGFIGGIPVAIYALAISGRAL